MIMITHSHINQIPALNNPFRVDMPLNKLIKPKQTKLRTEESLEHFICSSHAH